MDEYGCYICIYIYIHIHIKYYGSIFVLSSNATMYAKHVIECYKYVCKCQCMCTYCIYNTTMYNI